MTEGLAFPKNKRIVNEDRKMKDCSECKHLFSDSVGGSSECDEIVWNYCDLSENGVFDFSYFDHEKPTPDWCPLNSWQLSLRSK